MKAFALLLVGIVVFVAAYALYGRWLARKWGVDPTRKTPAVEINDRTDYVPSKRYILLGHHFSSIAGAGPINGPIQAAVFGWLPVSLWIIIGTVFFGGPHDMGSLFYSVRNKGKSFFVSAGEFLGPTAKYLLLIFFYFNAVLLIAAFLSIVADSFTSTGAGNIDGPRVAMISITFIPMAMLLGIYINRYRPSTLPTVIVGLLLLMVSIIIGFNFPVNLPYWCWIAIIVAYILVASLLPVWLLLQPRDFLCSFLLYGTMLLAFIGIFFSNPELKIPAFTSFETESGLLFPVLFITVACGAVSGFHTIVSTGTTSKQISSEADVAPIGYGGMLIESVLALIALIAVASLFTGSFSSDLTPLQIFATGITGMFDAIGFGDQHTIIYCILMLSVSAFVLTSLDTCTRIGRYMIQELACDREGKLFNKLRKPLFATVLTVGLATSLSIIGYQALWSLFGTLNQLMAAFALMLVASWLSFKGREFRMLIVPATMMFITTISMLVYLIVTKAGLLMDSFDATELILMVLSAVLLVGTIYILWKEYQFIRKSKGSHHIEVSE